MEKYRNLQIKLTPQRLAILNYLEGNKSHPSADEIYKAVLKKFPTMSFATVYNTLDALREKGYVIELTIDPAKKRFDESIAHQDRIEQILRDLKRDEADGAAGAPERPEDTPSGKSGSHE